eukprot:TRINITY_DN56171_c0_g1_i2.p1 TRINITY_DN56171_c0_g1~~TRINITY_DN56171_c0_g1_i2.p1  ORF type:complete len:269 (-),score=18.86 TRINITY_DN56171_c0_g1_i2:302-1108(-)
MDYLLHTVPARLIAPLRVPEARMVATLSKTIRSLLREEDIGWVPSPTRCLGGIEITPETLKSALATFPEGLVETAGWPLKSAINGTDMRGTTGCCWSILRLALKPQHVAILPGSCLHDVLGGVLCITCLSRLHSDSDSADWRRAGRHEVSAFAQLIGVSSKGSPDSPAGLEHAAQAVIAPTWSALWSFLRTASPSWYTELCREYGFPDHVDNTTSSADLEDDYDGMCMWMASPENPRGDFEFVSFMSSDAILDLIDSFVKSRTTEDSR